MELSELQEKASNEFKKFWGKINKARDGQYWDLKLIDINEFYIQIGQNHQNKVIRVYLVGNGIQKDFYNYIQKLYYQEKSCFVLLGNETLHFKDAGEDTCTRTIYITHEDNETLPQWIYEKSILMANVFKQLLQKFRATSQNICSSVISEDNGQKKNEQKINPNRDSVQKIEPRCPIMITQDVLSILRDLGSNKIKYTHNGVDYFLVLKNEKETRYNKKTKQKEIVTIGNPLLKQKTTDNEVITLDKITSWPLFFKGALLTGDKAVPPHDCPHCNQHNSVNCLKSGMCIFSVRQDAILKPQFVFLGENWSENANKYTKQPVWGNGNNIQGKILKGTFAEGGFFTDFIKCKIITHLSSSKAVQWLASEPLNGVSWFEIYLSIFNFELSRLNCLFKLDSQPKFIFVWGKTLYKILDDASLKCKHLHFNELFYGENKINQNDYNIRIMGMHYSPNGNKAFAIDEEKSPDNPTYRSRRRAYISVEDIEKDRQNDQERYDFLIQ